MIRSIAARDKLLGVGVSGVAFGVVFVLGMLLFDMIGHGLRGIDLGFFFDPPSKAGRAGGIGPIIVSTALVVGIALAAALPPGIATAILLSDFTRVGSRYAYTIRKCLDILAGVPSIVFGLFGNAFFSNWLGLGFSILSGGLTLACMVLPILIRMMEESLRSVPAEYRTGMAALGFSKTASILYLILPMAVPGLIAGTILGFGRAIAETAALIFTSGYVDRMPDSVFDSGRTLSIHIYDLAMNIPGGDVMAYKTSFVLVLLLLLITAATNYFARVFLRRGIQNREYHQSSNSSRKSLPPVRAKERLRGRIAWGFTRTGDRSDWSVGVRKNQLLALHQSDDGLCG